MFQATFEMPEDTIEQINAKYLHLAQLSEDFVNAVKAYGRVIVAELHQRDHLDDEADDYDDNDHSEERSFSNRQEQDMSTHAELDHVSAHHVYGEETFMEEHKLVLARSQSSSSILSPALFAPSKPEHKGSSSLPHSRSNSRVISRSQSNSRLGHHRHSSRPGSGHGNGHGSGEDIGNFSVNVSINHQVKAKRKTISRTHAGGVAGEMVDDMS